MFKFMYFTDKLIVTFIKSVNHLDSLKKKNERYVQVYREYQRFINKINKDFLFE